MAHVGVGAASNQFVLYLNGHVAAPVLAQGVTRPKGESNAEGSENKSDDRYWGALRKKSSPQHSPERGAREEQDPCCQQWDLIHDSRARGLLRLDCLQAQGRNQPIGKKNNPKRSQSITTQAIHNTNFLNFRSPVVLRRTSGGVSRASEGGLHFFVNPVHLVMELGAFQFGLQVHFVIQVAFEAVFSGLAVF